MGYIKEFSYYDFHVYYQSHQAVSRDKAVAFRNKILEEFAEEVSEGKIVVKELREPVVGPHITNFFEYDIQDPQLFVYVFSWTQLNRNGLDIIVHPNSTNQYRDHINYPTWLGNKLPLITEGILFDDDREISKFGLLRRQPIEELKILKNVNSLKV